MKRTLLAIALFGLSTAVLFSSDKDLAQAFRNPPDSAKPWVYWFWLDGNLSREGITADLEAMHRVGIRGVLIMEVDQGIPKGPAPFLSSKWRELFKHVVKEATRLGIEVNMNNDGGWCGSGGPWITPELSMQVVVWSEIHVTGPRRLEMALPQPKATQNFYRDIAVLAFPTPPAEGTRMAAASPKFTTGAGHQALDGAANLTDGNAGTVATLPAPARGEPQLLDIEFPKPFTTQALTVALDAHQGSVSGTLGASDDGREFKTIRAFTLMWPSSSVNFDKVSARYFRLAFHPGRGGPAALPIGEVELHAGRRIEGIPAKAAYITPAFLPGGAGPAPSAAMAVVRDKILDVTAKMDNDGRLTWDVPAGNWTLLRFGYTTTGKMNHPAPKESLGLECDKLSKRAVDVHFAGLMGKLVEDQRAAGGKALAYTHIDSWEVGSQNWTPRFREEFRARRGYDPLLYLPVLTGRAVENEEVSERFLWDLRRTVADLLLDNYAGHFQKLSREHGIKLSIEAYGDGPFDSLPYAGRADMPVTEFWIGQEPWWITKQMASAAHVYGRPILAAEAFTARPAAGRWLNHPFRMKPLGDQMFTLGVNRYIFHRYAMQPWLDRKPGMTMGQWGIHFERTNTWWEQSKAWLAYVARCQYLLQQGHFVADVAYASSERAPSGRYTGYLQYDFDELQSVNSLMPPGYDYDAVPAELLLSQMSVRDGRLTLPSGMSYRVLVLPSATTMRLAQLRKIKELVEAGATVVGPPPSKSPSLAEYHKGDAEVRRIAAELWADCDGINITEHRLGKGRVVWGRSLAHVLSEAGVPPDFSSVGVEVGKQIRYIHRRVDGKEIYFIASAESQAATFLCTFRVGQKRPELWWPDTGRIERAAVYDQPPGQTRIPIRLDPYGSVFVVFEDGGANSPERLAAVTRNGVEGTGILATAGPDLRGKMDGIAVERDEGTGYRIEVAQPGTYHLKTAGGKTLSWEVPALPKPIEITGPWELFFPKGSGAPEHVTLDGLISWTSHRDEGVKYFSGTATYRRRIEIPAAMFEGNRGLYLDLGRVQVIAEVKLNGRALGILWKPPFRVDITQAARAGQNDLEVQVVNLWPNRLIGDDRLPEDTERAGPRLKEWPRWLLEGKSSPTGRLTFTTWKHWTKDDPLLESGLLGPVRIHATERAFLRP